MKLRQCSKAVSANKRRITFKAYGGKGAMNKNDAELPQIKGVRI